MPSLIKVKGVPRYRASVPVPGNQDQRKQKLFPDDSKESYLQALAWEETTRRTLQENQARMACIRIGKWADQYLDYVQSRFVEKTYKEKKAVLKKFFNFNGVRPNMSLYELVESSRSDVSLAYAFLKKQFEERGGYSANKDRKNLSAAWVWGSKYLMDFPRDIINPFYVVEKFPEVRCPRYVPPEEDFWKVYHAAKEQQDKVMLLTAFHLAARRGEIFQMKRADIDFSNNNVRLWTRKRKGGNLEADWLPMTQALREALFEWCEYRFSKVSWDEENVFVCLSETAYCDPHYGRAFKYRLHFMNRLCKKAGVKPFGFHAIRHLSATVLYHRGKELYYLQRFLRHKDPMTTQRYLHRLGLDSLREGINEGFSNSSGCLTPPQEIMNSHLTGPRADSGNPVSRLHDKVIIFPGQQKGKNKAFAENGKKWPGDREGVQGCFEGVCDKN